jgi:hypothetical protein
MLASAAHALLHGTKEGDGGGDHGLVNMPWHYIIVMSVST